MNISVLVCLLAGLLPILAAHLAYFLNLGAPAALAPEFVCLPYVDGCVSVSRAARSEPGLTWFRLLMLPAALLLALTWMQLRSWIGRAGFEQQRLGQWLSLLGVAGAMFLVLYVTALGSEGEWYRWQRRYGVTLYFGGTALAQLLLVRVLWWRRQRLRSPGWFAPAATLTVLVSLQWALGVFSSVKRLIFKDPLLLDRLENVTEWWFALLMSAAFIAIAWLLSQDIEKVRLTGD